jgi:hypothetical protein
MSGNGVHELTLLDEAKHALSEACSFEQIKDIRDKAEAVRKYAQSAALGLDIQNRAAEVKLRAERRAGKLLAQLLLRGGDRRSKARHNRLKLDDLGITRNQSTRWQIQAKVPEDIFGIYIRQTCDAGKELTSANLMRIAKKWGNRENSHSNGNGSNNKPPDGDDRISVDRLPHDNELSPDTNLMEIVGDLKNHYETMNGIVEPIIQNECGVSLKPAERRILRYLLREIHQLLDRLDGMQSASVGCSCANDRRRF